MRCWNWTNFFAHHWNNLNTTVPDRNPVEDQWHRLQSQLLVVPLKRRHHLGTICTALLGEFAVTCSWILMRRMLRNVLFLSSVSQQCLLYRSFVLDCGSCFRCRSSTIVKNWWIWWMLSVCKGCIVLMLGVDTSGVERLEGEWIQLSWMGTRMKEK